MAVKVFQLSRQVLSQSIDLLLLVAFEIDRIFT